MGEYQKTVLTYEKCPTCYRTQHPDFLHLELRDCQVALAAALGATNEFADQLDKRLLAHFQKSQADLAKLEYQQAMGSKFPNPLKHDL